MLRKDPQGPFLQCRVLGGLCCTSNLFLWPLTPCLSHAPLVRSHPQADLSNKPAWQFFRFSLGSHLAGSGLALSSVSGITPGGARRVPYSLSNLPRPCSGCPDTFHSISPSSHFCPLPPTCLQLDLSFYCPHCVGPLSSCPVRPQRLFSSLELAPKSSPQGVQDPPSVTSAYSQWLLVFSPIV